MIHPHVVIESGAEIGDGVEIFPGAYIGRNRKVPVLYPGSPNSSEESSSELIHQSVRTQSSSRT